MEDREAEGMDERALCADAVGGRENDRTEGAEVTGVTVVEDELVVTTLARRRETEASVSFMVWTFEYSKRQVE